MPGDVTTCQSCSAKNRLKTPPPGRLPRCGRCGSALPWVTNASDADFDRSVDAPTPVVVDLWAPWCGPCRTMTPILEALAAEYAGRLKIVKVNVDENAQVHARFRVQGIPMLVLLAGGEVVDTAVGLRPKAELERWIGPHLPPPADRA